MIDNFKLTPKKIVEAYFNAISSNIECAKKQIKINKLEKELELEKTRNEILGNDNRKMYAKCKVYERKYKEMKLKWKRKKQD